MALASAVPAVPAAAAEAAIVVVVAAAVVAVARIGAEVAEKLSRRNIDRYGQKGRENK